MARKTEFTDFVQQLEIEDVRLYKAKIENLGFWDMPDSDDVQVDVRTRSHYEDKKDGFVAYEDYIALIRNARTSEKVARISVTFAVSYFSKIPLNDRLFNQFKAINLPLNTWPYFREFVHNVSARMGLPLLIAPALKIPLAGPVSKIKSM